MLVAVDTGGTKTLLAAFRTDGTIASSHKFPTPKDFTAYLDELLAGIAHVAQGQPIDALSIALPGTIADGRVAWCSNLPWRDVDVIGPVQKIYPTAAIFLENDANLAGLGETRMLDMQPKTSLYITFSTGIGTGVTTNGHIDPHFRLSEAGHAVLNYNGTYAPWESFASGRAIYETYGQYARDITDPTIWKDVAERMAQGMLVLLPFMQPDIVIIGGSMGSYFERYGDFLIDSINTRLHDEIIVPPIIGAKHPEEAVIHGCYYYALDHLTAS